jgi:hypothetical protein
VRKGRSKPKGKTRHPPSLTHTHTHTYRVERCLLHMDVKILDFDSVLRLLRAEKVNSV